MTTSTGDERHERVEIVNAEGHAADEVADFGAEVRAGLTQAQKELPFRYLYDDEGSRLFEEITKQPEYYPPQAEREILQNSGAEIIASLPKGAALVELGSGSSEKTRLLIEAAIEAWGKVLYCPLDISRSILEESADALCEDHPALSVIGAVGEYSRAVPALFDEVPAPRVVIWLGSSVGNFTRAAAAAFMGEVAERLQADDRLLVGVDLRKGRDVLERAYDDKAGVTGRFNMNMLTRINRELNGEFDLSKFSHRAHWNADLGRVEMHLVSSEDQTVRIGALDLSVPFSAGETIHTESAHKYSRAEIVALADAAGLRLESTWTDALGRFEEILLRHK